MISPARPANEQARLNILHSLNIADSAPEERFDRLTRLARRLFDVPIALVSLLEADRQWVKSAAGHASKAEPSHEMAFAGHTLFVELTLVVEGGATVEAAHALCDRIEAAIAAEVDGAEVVIHVEPRSRAPAAPRDRRSFRERGRTPAPAAPG